MRGKPHRYKLPRASSRITPADAGKTSQATCSACIFGGSPPRMRGKRNPTYEDFGEDRITPADAGKTATPRTRFVVSRDHPRGCGENGNTPNSLCCFTGSPPRMRGKLRPLSGGQPCGGITPADAGKTRFRPPTEARDKDHPRGCGENPNDEPAPLHTAGSPPRMRGKLRLTVPSGARLRITPADAGKTDCCNQPLNHTQDHPRGCGENTKKIL